MGAHSTRVCMSPNLTFAKIYNTFPGEHGFFSEEDPPWKVRIINTTVQVPSPEIDSWHKIFWTHCLYSLGVVRGCSCWLYRIRQTVLWFTLSLRATHRVLVVASSSTAWSTVSSNSGIWLRRGAPQSDLLAVNVPAGKPGQRGRVKMSRDVERLTSSPPIAPSFLVQYHHIGVFPKCVVCHVEQQHAANEW